MTATSTSTQQTPPAGPPRLPDLNAETNPFWMVQGLLGQSGYINLFAITNSFKEITDSGKVIGFEGIQTVHVFDIKTQAPTEHGIHSDNAIGQPYGEHQFKLLIIPEDYHAIPNQTPPRTAYDPTRRQRFVLTTSDLTLGAPGGSTVALSLFGTGRIFDQPDANGTRSLGGVSIVLSGPGSMEGRETMAVFNGRFDDNGGFHGNINLESWQLGDVPSLTNKTPLSKHPSHRTDDSYMMLRYEKPVYTGPDGKINVKPEGLASYIFGPHGMPVGGHTENPLKLIQTEFEIEAATIETEVHTGEQIGNLSGNVYFDLTYPAGTPLIPSNYVSRNLMTFFAKSGKEVGSFVASVEEGRSFTLKLPGLKDQIAVNFAGFGPITEGRGIFEGISGIWSDNSSIGISPFATVGLGVFRFFNHKKKTE